MNRSMMLYKIEAHMGMALMAEQQHDHKTAIKEVGRVLQKSREVGAPRMAAHALLFSANLEENEAAKQNYLQDALAIYQLLNDVRGKKDVFLQLKELAEKQGDTTGAEALQEQLDLLEKR